MRKLFLIFLFILLPYSAWSATYYVCSTGCNDANGGTSTGQCVASISRAHELAGNNDTVSFCPAGTWTGTAIITAESGVTYIGNDTATWGSGTRAKLQATGSTTAVVLLDTSSVVFRGFEVDVNEQAATGIGIGRTGTASGITVDDCVVHDTASSGWLYGITIGWSSIDASNVTVQNTEVYNVAQELVTVYPNGGEVSNLTIRNCKIHDGGEAAEQHYGDGIILKNDVHDITIEYNTIYNCSMPGVSFSQSSSGDVGFPYSVIIRYNLFYNNYSGITWDHADTYDSAAYSNIFYNNGYHPDRSGGQDMLLSGATAVNIYNNTIYNTRSLSNGSVYAAAASGTVNFVNNAIYTTNAEGVKDAGGYLTHSYNLVYRASGNAVTDNGSSYTSAQIANWDNTAIGTDPAFSGGTLPTGFSGTYGSNMVPNTDYFQLTVDSPAKDAGATLASYTGAINGAGLATPIVRPLGAAFDIGAYEYGTVAQSGGSAGQGFKIQGVTIR